MICIQYMYYNYSCMFMFSWFILVLYLFYTIIWDTTIITSYIALYTVNKCHVLIQSNILTFPLGLGPGLLYSKFCLLCFWAVLKKVTYSYYAQNYNNPSLQLCHNSYTVLLFLLTAVRLQPVVFYIILCCSALIFYILCSILCSWE